MNDIKIGCGVKGVYKMQVLENGKVVEDRPWAENMILNQGLDYALSGNYNNFPELMRYHCVGTLNTAVDATQIGLGAEAKRTGTILVSGSGYSDVGGTRTFRYTFDHSVEGVGGANYAEHGLSPSGTPGNNLFSRSLISGGTISVAEGQQLRVIYDVSVTVTPSTPTAVTVGGTGWPVSPATNCDGLAICSPFQGLIGYISGTGGPAGIGLMLFTQSYTTLTITAASSITLPTVTQSTDNIPYVGINGSDITYNKQAYVAGSFSRTFTPSHYATASSWASTGIRGFVVTSPQAMAIRYTQAQTKANTHRLRYPSITITWARA